MEFPFIMPNCNRPVAPLASYLTLQFITIMREHDSIIIINKTVTRCSFLAWGLWVCWTENNRLSFEPISFICIFLNYISIKSQSFNGLTRRIRDKKIISGARAPVWNAWNADWLECEWQASKWFTLLKIVSKFIIRRSQIVSCSKIKRIT